MGCDECDKQFENGEGVYPYRWGTATISIIACKQHAIEVIQALNDHQFDCSAINAKKPTHK